MTNDIKMAIDAANKIFSEGFLKSNASITASGFANDAVVFPPDGDGIADSCSLPKGHDPVDNDFGSLLHERPLAVDEHELGVGSKLDSFQ